MVKVLTSQGELIFSDTQASHYGVGSDGFLYIYPRPECNAAHEACAVFKDWIGVWAVNAPECQP